MPVFSFRITAVLRIGIRCHFFYKRKSTVRGNCAVAHLSTSTSRTPEAHETKKIMGWQDEKNRYLNMSLSEKRKEYRRAGSFHTLDDVKTWHDYAMDCKESIAAKIPLLPGTEIDNSLNKQLVKKVSLFVGDITTLEIDAIVNAANKSLMGGMGVDGAIHLGAGPLLLEENRTLGGCNVGEAKITGGYKLPAKYVIPTVGPQGEYPELLRQCYKNSIDLMLLHELRTIAFPCISTGVYGYPLVPAAHVAVKQVRSQLERNMDNIDRVIFCLFSEADEEVYQGVMQSYFPLTE